MRSYGRDEDGKWVQIDAPDYIYLATLVQTLRLSQNESPIYGNYGIPAQQSVLTRVAPDAAVSRTQSQYASYFASLTVVKDQAIFEPTYYVTAIFKNGHVVRQIVT
jgi:hypothetical protein